MDYPSYDPKSPNTPLTEDELAAPRRAARRRCPSDGAMTLDGMDGYLTALLVGPPPLAAREDRRLAARDLGRRPGARRPRRSRATRSSKRTTVLVLRHLRSIAAALSRPAGRLGADLQRRRGAGHAGRASWPTPTDWCLGFLAATDLAPDAWAPLYDDPELGPGLATIALLGGDVDARAPTRRGARRRRGSRRPAGARPAEPRRRRGGAEAVGAQGGVTPADAAAPR